MADMNRANFEAALKVLYPHWKLMTLAYEASPAFAALPKRTDFVGDYAKCPMIYTGVPSISADLATALTNRDYSKSVAMAVTRARKYATAGIEREVVLASESNQGAVISATKSQMDAVIRSLGHTISVDLFADSQAGSIGTLSVTVACPITGPTAQLADVEDAVAFEEGAIIVFATNATVNPHAGTLTVASVDRDLGRVTFTANLNTIVGLATGHLMFRQGDYTAANDTLCIGGFASWIPAVAPVVGGGDAFYGVDRSADPTRLAGLRYSTTTHPGYSTEDALLLLASRVAREGGKPDVAFCGFDRYRALSQALDAKAEFGKMTVKIAGAPAAQATIGFDTISVIGPRGVIEVLPDACCPEDTMYCLTKNTWEFKSLGAAPRPILLDGKWSRDSHNSDDIEIRTGCYGNLLCKAPGHNARFDW